MANLLARADRSPLPLECSTVWLNGAPAVRVEFDGELGAAVSLVIDGGRVTRVYIMRNPHKLGYLDEPAQLAR